MNYLIISKKSMIYIILETGEQIILTGKLEQDYIKSVRHENVHKRINETFGVKSNLEYHISKDEKGNIIGSGGGALTIYPNFYQNPLKYFKYILLELTQLIYEFIFALFQDFKQFFNIRDWISTFFSNLYSIFPRRDLLSENMILYDIYYIFPKCKCSICRKILSEDLIENNCNIRRIDVCCSNLCDLIMKKIVNSNETIKKKRDYLLKLQRVKKYQFINNIRIRLFERVLKKELKKLLKRYQKPK